MPYTINVYLKEHGLKEHGLKEHVKQYILGNKDGNGHILNNSLGGDIEIVKKGDIFCIYTSGNKSCLALYHKTLSGQSDYNNEQIYNQPPEMVKSDKTDWPYQIIFDPFVRTNFKVQDKWSPDFILYKLCIHLCPKIGDSMFLQFSNIKKYGPYRQLKAEGQKASYLRKTYSLSVSELRAIGYTAKDLKDDGFYDNEIRDNYTYDELIDSGYMKKGECIIN
jgi:hypothetical protein